MRYLDTVRPQALEWARTTLADDEHAQRYHDEARGDADYALWLWLVDLVMRRKWTVRHNDLVDMCWRDMYDEGQSPHTAAHDAIEHELSVSGY